jgi:hypothetical protein
VQNPDSLASKQPDITTERAPGATPIPPTTFRHDQTIIFLLCCLAAVHLFFFSVSFPPANNVDEYLHFDVAVRYSQGHIPGEADLTSEEAMQYLVRYGTYEYCFSPDMLPNQTYPPPFWTLRPDQVDPLLLKNRPMWQRPNYESAQPPLYYAVAGLWWHVGHWLSLPENDLYFWMRQLDIVIIIPVIWLAYFTAKKVFPGNRFLQLGVPALIALMPQAEFYSIDNDNFSPLCFGMTFLLLLKWLEKPSARLGAALGLAFGATFLAKLTNLPLLAVAGAVIALKILQCIRNGEWRACSSAVTAFVACALPPIFLWMLWCKVHYGDLFGNSNVRYLGWTVKPFSQWWHHPIFSPHGLWVYLSGQIGTFWQGDFWWHDHPMAWPQANAGYTLLSTILLAAAIFAIRPGFSRATPIQRHALLIGLTCFLAGLAFFGLMSIVYDFHDCPNPSRALPFFQAGRMLLGTLIPFMLLFVYGLDRLLNRHGILAKFIVLAAIICAMLAMEITTAWPVFSSPFNWFHMPPNLPLASHLAG